MTDEMAGEPEQAHRAMRQAQDRRFERGGNAAAEPEQAHRAMRQAQDRRFEREGIPMVLALFDEGAPERQLPVCGEPAVVADGEDYARIAGDWADALYPQVADTDLAASIVVLQAMSYARLLPASAEQEHR